MSILSVDNISPIGSGTSVTINNAATLVLNNLNVSGVSTFSNSVIVKSGNLELGSTNGTDSIIHTTNAAGILYRADENGHRFQTYDGGWQDRLSIKDNGNTGIGTNNPTDILDINSDSASAVSNVYIRNHANLGGAALNLFTQGTYASPTYKAIIGCSDAGGNIRMGSASNHDLLLLTNNTARVTIGSDGSSTFYSPATAWAEGPVVLEASNGYAEIFFRSTGSTHGTSISGTWGIGKLAGTDGFGILKQTMTGGGAVRQDAAINISNAGDTKIGKYLAVGHNTPATRLDVKQNNGVAYNNRAQSITYGAARFLNTSGHTSGGTYTGYQFNITGDSQNRICSIGMITEASNSRASSLVFATDDNGNRTEKLRITSTGDVNIGGISLKQTQEYIYKM